MLVRSASASAALLRASINTRTVGKVHASSKNFAARKALGTSMMSLVRSFSANNTSSPQLMYDVVPESDKGEFKEYSVIYTNRALNLMSVPFQTVMKDLNNLMKTTYQAHKVAIIPGSGTFGMEAVARQFATNEHCVVIRNGWFSYRWTEIFDMGASSNQTIPKSHTVLKAQQINDTSNGDLPQYAPYPIEKVLETIYEEKPKVMFAPHVETSTGMILPDDYIRQAAQAMHEVGGLFVLDCVASGTVWAEMKDLEVDVVISAPQKGWTGPACAALVMMSERATQTMMETEETSFSMSLKRWSAIMDTYENGGFGYHTTLPTDALRQFHEISVETLKFGIPELKSAQIELGQKAHETMQSKGLKPVAAPGYESPGVLVYYSPTISETSPTQIENPVMMQKFKQNGLQIAMGVPWKIDEPETPMKTFRMGLFGLDKLADISETVDVMDEALDNIMGEIGSQDTKVA